MLAVSVLLALSVLLAVSVLLTVSVLFSLSVLLAVSVVWNVSVLLADVSPRGKLYKENIARIAKGCPENITSVVKWVKLPFPKVLGKNKKKN